MRCSRAGRRSRWSTSWPTPTHRARSIEKRWEDVDQLLDAGIDVISTVNIQHIESLNDVVRQITGVQQRETIPDAVLRRANQVELVDLAPQALRDRLSAGLVYPTARVDAALSNYFRLGNLTALRELGAALAGGRGGGCPARLPQRAGHRHDLEHSRASGRRAHGRGRGRDPDPPGVSHRGAVERWRAVRGARDQFGRAGRLRPGGTRRAARARRAVRRIVPPGGRRTGSKALVAFARSVDATQLVIGVSRRSRLASFLTGPGTAATVIRESGDIDVHIVSHAEAGSRRLPSFGGALSVKRRLIGFLITAVGLPLITWALTLFRSDELATTEVLLFQLFVVIVAVVGGIWPALVAAVGAGFMLDFFFVEPLYTVTIADPLHLLALVIFIVVAVLVSIVVDQAARRARAANRAAAEAETLSRIASSVLSGGDPLTSLVGQLRESFGMTSVIVYSDGVALASATDAELAADEDVETRYPLGPNVSIYLRGKELDARDRRILSAFLSQLETAVRQRELTDETARMRPVAEADRLRTALLAAVGHDLRRPLAAATAAVTSLRSKEVKLSPKDRAELLATAEESLDSLATLVTALLDASRLQAGVLGVAIESVALDDVVGGALEELGLGPGQVEVELGADLPAVAADRILLQRAIVNLVSNALRYAPEGTAPVISTSAFGDRVQLRVIDEGPGIPAGTARGCVRAVPASRRHRQHHGCRARPRPLEGFRRGDGGHARGGGHPRRRAHDGDRAAGGRLVKLLIADDDPRWCGPCASRSRPTATRSSPRVTGRRRWMRPSGSIRT